MNAAREEAGRGGCSMATGSLDADWADGIANVNPAAHERTEGTARRNHDTALLAGKATTQAMNAIEEMISSARGTSEAVKQEPAPRERHKQYQRC